MNLQDWLRTFASDLHSTRPIEWIAASFGVAEVLLAKYNKVWLYPAGIVSSAIYIYILHHAGLNAESWLNAYYVVMSLYGWYHWSRRKNEPALPVTRNSSRDWLITCSIVTLGWALIFAVLRVYNPSPVNALDALISATAWAGMWLLAKRKLQNWILLNISNIIAIPLLLYKKYPVTAFLTLFLFVVAVFGYVDWRRIMRAEEGRKKASGRQNGWGT